MPYNFYNFIFHNYTLGLVHLPQFTMRNVFSFGLWVLAKSGGRPSETVLVGALVRSYQVSSIQ